MKFKGYLCFAKSVQCPSSRSSVSFTSGVSPGIWSPDAWIPLDQGEGFPKTTRVVAPKFVAAEEIWATKEVAERGARSEKNEQKNGTFAHSPATLEENAYRRICVCWMDGSWAVFFRCFRFVLLVCKGYHPLCRFVNDTVFGCQLWHPEHPGRKSIF